MLLLMVMVLLIDIIIFYNIRSLAIIVIGTKLSNNTESTDNRPISHLDLGSMVPSLDPPKTEHVALSIA